MTKDQYFSAENKRKTATLFAQNLLWGKIRIEYDKFPSTKEGLEFAEQMYKKLTAWDNESLCGDDDPNYEKGLINWIYDSIIKARSYGALIGEMKDKTYEVRIEELEKEVGELRDKNNTLRSHNIQLSEELMDRRLQITAYEKLFYKKPKDDAGESQ
jgi:hypothetical protein